MQTQTQTQTDVGDIEKGLLESVEQNQVKENCIMKRCGCIMTLVNVLFIALLITGSILGLLKINNKL